MNRSLSILYRAISWVCAGVSVANGAIIVWSVSLGKIGVGYVIVNIIVGLLFCMIGFLVFVLERNIARLYRHVAGHELMATGSEMTSSWRSVFLILIISAAMVTLLMVGAATGIISRVFEGYPIFG